MYVYVSVDDGRRQRNIQRNIIKLFWIMASY